MAIILNWNENICTKSIYAWTKREQTNKTRAHTHTQAIFLIRIEIESTIIVTSEVLLLLLQPNISIKAEKKKNPKMST